MTSRSVAVLIYAIITAFVIGLLALCSAHIYASLSQYQESIETERRTRADKALFDALSFVRLQRGQAQTAIQTLDSPGARIREVRAAADVKLAEALLAFDGVDTPKKAALSNQIKSDLAALKPHYDRVLTEAEKPRADRKLADVAPWADAIGTLLDSLENASDAVSAGVRMTDGYFSELTQVRKTS